MTNEIISGSILRTKLHRPPIPRDHVHRMRLLEYLDQRRDRPLTLVSAPAGYGKSILISRWMETCNLPNAWLSLDERDSDLRQFLSYFLVAVQNIFPDTMTETATLVQAQTLPPLTVLAGILANELDAIAQDFILVMDDIHRVQEKSVYELLTGLLQHPPRTMHLVLIGRRDVNIPIASFRAGGLATEIRLNELRFTAQETASYFKTVLGDLVDKPTAANLAEKSEGWIASLRLAVLAARGHDDAIDKLLELKGTMAYVMDYLIAEVLNVQSPIIRHYLLSTSILDRFNAALCDVLFGPDSRQGESEMDGNDFIAKLQSENLFLIALDAENGWFRYHHLFQDLLQSQLKRRCRPEEIATLQLQASEWFEGMGLIDESLKLALQADDVERATQIIERNSRPVMNEDKWHVLEKWLSKLPDAVVWNRPELLIVKALKHFYRLDLPAILPVLDRIDKLAGSGEKNHDLSGEVAMFRGVCLFYQGEAARALKSFEHAMDRVSLTDVEFRSIIEVHFVLAAHMEGQMDRAILAVNEWLKTRSPLGPLTETRLLLALTLVSCQAGDLEGAERHIPKQRKVAVSNGLDNATAWCDYLKGLSCLQRGELDEAIRLLEAAGKRKYFLFTRAAVDTLGALALAYQANGLPEQAGATMQSLRELTTYLGLLFNPLADAYAARLALMRGRPEVAVRWMATATSPPAEVMLWWFETPCVTWCRALISEGSATGLRDAEKRLRVYADQNEAHHNTCQLIGILSLLAIACQKQDKNDVARATLEKALTLARPGGLLFPFLEIGRPVAGLLKQLQKQDVAVDQIEKILAAFNDNEPIAAAKADDHPIASPNNGRASNASQSLVNPLTHRELDVLELLAQRLQNKEIADKLFITPETVKTHLQNIYQKINVHKRNEAVCKARDLGILTRR